MSPSLDPEARKELLGPNKHYCRQCDEFFEDNEAKHEGHRVYRWTPEGVKAIPDFDNLLTSGGSTGPIGHMVNTYQKCPRCGGTDFEVRNHDLMWHDGEVWCVPCNVFVRGYDAG